MEAALALYVDEAYDASCKAFASLISNPPKNINLSDLYSKYAASLMKTTHYEDALVAIDESIALQNDQSITYLRKGMICFFLEKYQDAQKAFLMTKEMAKKEEIRLVGQCETWLRKCAAEVQDEMNNKPAESHVQMTPAMAAEECDEMKVEEPVKPLIRYDWFQTNTHVSISIMQKKLNSEDVTIVFESNRLQVYITLHGEKITVLNTYLYDTILVEECSYRISPVKVEIKMKKTSPMQWDALMQCDKLQQAQVSTGASSAVPRPYSSSKDWEKIDQEMKADFEKEKPEGEQAMHKLFQDIFKNANEDTRRAMNKSFQTSGGTVLSTNWNEVGEKNYEEDKPAPDGMEWKKWG